MTTFGGSWTQEKLDILRAYLDAYTTALKDQPFQLIYVDAFAGEGFWRPGSDYMSEEYGEFADLLKGSAAIALEIQDKPFDRLVFIEKDLQRCRTQRFPRHSQSITGCLHHCLEGPTFPVDLRGCFCRGGVLEALLGLYVRGVRGICGPVERICRDCVRDPG